MSKELRSFLKKVPGFTILPSGLYSLGTDYHGITAVIGQQIDTHYCTLFDNGLLLLKSGFIWNGPSGPAINTPATLMPSALHDCLYRLIQEGELEKDHREASDYTYRDSLKTWGVPLWRRLLHFRAVRLFGGFYVDAPPILED